MIQMSITPPPPMICFAPKGFFCSDLHSLEQCPENWYCRGGLLPPARCPDGKWSAVGSAYLADCGNSFEANVAVLITIIIVFAGLSLCVWAYCDCTSMLCMSMTPAPRGVYVVHDDCFNRSCRSNQAQGAATTFHPGRPPTRYFLIPGTIPPV
jgi:hypothetical protein